jgi:hypothetical protein
LHFNLRFLNVWIGLCRGDAELPQDLRMLGYEDQAIEKEFRNEAGALVCPEVLTQSEQERHTILIESKAGSNLDVDQLSRYAGVTANDLVSRAFVPNVCAEAHDTVMVGQARHADELIKALENSGHSMPFLAVTDSGIALKANGFQRQAIEDAFTPELEIPWDQAPMMFVPIDSDSLDWEVADAIVPLTLAHMGNRVPLVTMGQLAQEACFLTWGAMGRAGKGGIKSQVTEIIKNAADEELGEWYAFEQSGGNRVRFENNPFKLGGRQQSASLQRLRRAHDDFRERLRTTGTQLSLETERTEPASH